MTAHTPPTTPDPPADAEDAGAPEGPPEARSLLFLSCDIVGSTRYKQSMALWRRTFLSFYREFPQLLADLASADEFKPEFTLWKPVGDELIFTVVVRHEVEIYQAVRLWLAAMDGYEKGSLEETSLATKGGAFIATFPGPDSESSIPRDPTIETSDKGVFELNAEALATRSNDYMYDYFGPSIDTGFRVIGVCDQRFFTLSVEVAWAMARCALDAGADGDKYPLKDLRLRESREFKGVWNGRSYPLFAIDRHQTDLINVALAAIENNGLEAHQVVNLCRECANDPAWPSHLYLPDSDHPCFLQVPEAAPDELLNSMEGAETVPDDDIGTVAELEVDAPMPEAQPSEPSGGDHGHLHVRRLRTQTAAEAVAPGPDAVEAPATDGH